MEKDDHYIYHGPVWNTFNNLIEERWYGETFAKTKEKAISNLKHRFRKEYEMMNYSRLYLDPSRLSKKVAYDIKTKNEESFEDLEECKDDECQTYYQLTLF